MVNFVPSGKEIQKVRDVVTTETCNQCHDPLGAHGDFRRSVDLCVTCHYDGIVDPDTGNSVDFPVMVHKIHMGEDLPSVQTGEPYQIIGFRQGVNDYSTVVFPQDLRNCQTCHTDQASQAVAYLLRPSRAACGACHDEVNFVTGENHLGGPALSDSSCISCHLPEGDLEFDASIKGAHTIPAQSQQLAGINIEILEVINTGPGQNPTVFFTVNNDAGEPIAPGSLAFFNLLLAGPTTDYELLTSERAVEQSVPLDEGYTYTFETAIPIDATGTFAIGAEAFRTVVLNAGTTKELTQRETAENPMFYFEVTDFEPMPRRVVVTDEKCQFCHENLALHGTIRHNATEYCQICHNPLADDSPFRPEYQQPSRSIDFKMMIHRIHRGEELAREYSIIGFQGSVNNYNELLYPGDLRNCQACHVNDSYKVPSDGVLETITPREFFSPIPPNSTACLGCHDNLPAAAHAFLNIAPFGEACAVCHGPNADLAVARVHAR